MLAAVMTVGTGVNGQLAWMAAHEELVGLAKRCAEFDWREGTALLQTLRAEVHRHLGMASFAEYVERLFGCAPRTTEDKLRTAGAAWCQAAGTEPSSTCTT